MNKALKALLGAVFGMALLLTSLPAQDRDQPVKDEEAQDYYSKWLNEDVVYIITPEERSVFEHLATPEEKDQFIEQFWRRRDPDPTTAENEFKEEHYRRIAYANEHFHAGVAGWRTDRGMIYIRFGPPTGMEKHPEGGTYQRKMTEGGGTTYTHPFEVWFYNHIDGVGDGIEIEFVDTSHTNNYRIAINPDEKDALFWVPGAGQTLAEEMGTMSRLDRVRTNNLGNPEGGARGVDTAFYQRSYRDYPMAKLETLFKLSKSPAVKYKDLEKLVTARISYEQLPVQVQSTVLRMTEDHCVVPITLFVPNKDLSFKPLDENPNVLGSDVGVYGQVETLGGRLEYTFEDDIKQQFAKPQLAEKRTGYSMYQKQFPLAPGRYKLSLVVQDQDTSNIGSLTQVLQVPAIQGDALQASPVTLSRSVTLPPESETIGEPFVIGKYRVVPARGNHFRPEDQFAQAYFEVYNLLLDEATLQPSVKVEIALEHGRKEIFPWTPVNQEFEYVRDRLLIHKTMPFQGLERGSYSLRFKITDMIRGSSIEQKAEFVID
ncbi:MAG: GWxTD domain-containing protein [Acidobacteriota bacterium]